MAVRRPVDERPPTAIEEPIPEASTDEFACLVAGYAWRDGLTANAIVKKLNLPSEPRYLMQVKRGLKRAHNQFLVLKPLEHQALAATLSRVVNGRGRRATHFYVVEDSHGPSGAAVYAKAAELVVQIITEAVRTKPREEQVVVCNSGGRTISEMVKALQRNPPILDESDEKAQELAKRLIFVAANEAYQPDQFQRCANFLSVTMAELFQASHWALPRGEDEELRGRHQKLVEHSALLICSAGTIEGGLMSEYFKGREWKVPPEAVGDLAFNFLDRTGSAVSPSEEARLFLSTVNPTLDTSRLLHVAARSRVVLILDAVKPETKREIAAAALRRAYATDVVVGARLARAILREYGQHDA
jgi:DNA-binding transcriptional regulator LsrR (DeoR family)